MSTNDRILIGLKAALAIHAAVILSNLTSELSAGEQAPSPRMLETSPDSHYQAVLVDLAKATDRQIALQQMDRLWVVAGQDRSQLISQLLWYAAQNEKDESTRNVVGQIMKRVDASKDVIVTALVPHLDNRDATIRRVAAELLAGYEDRSAERPPDFSAYRAIIEADVRAGRVPQPSLVKFMYASEPGSALITMMRAYQLRQPEAIKSIRWTEHVVGELFWKRRYGFVDPKEVDRAAILELGKLSRHDQWWARLYVAVIVAKYPELGEPELIARLKADENVLVRESIRPPSTPIR